MTLSGLYIHVMVAQTIKKCLVAKQHKNTLLLYHNKQGTIIHVVNVCFICRLALTAALLVTKNVTK